MATPTCNEARVSTAPVGRHPPLPPQPGFPTALPRFEPSHGTPATRLDSGTPPAAEHDNEVDARCPTSTDTRLEVVADTLEGNNASTSSCDRDGGSGAASCGNNDAPIQLPDLPTTHLDSAANETRLAGSDNRGICGDSGKRGMFGVHGLCLLHQQCSSCIWLGKMVGLCQIKTVPAVLAVLMGLPKAAPILTATVATEKDGIGACT